LHLGVLSYGMVGLRADWGMQPSDTGVLSVTALLGQIVGSVGAGVLADRVGRRGSFALSAGMLGLFTGLGGLMPSLPWLNVCVFLGGIGMAGSLPAGLALLGELAPSPRRGLLVGLAEVLFSVGFLLSAISGAALVNTLGWRFVYYVGALPLLLVVAILVYVPESPRFLMAHGRQKEALVLIDRLNREHGLRLSIPEQERAVKTGLLPGLAELWSPRFRRRTAMVWLAWGSMQAAFYGPMLWFPLIFIGAGMSPELASKTGVLVAAVYVPPTVLSVLLVDRLGRKIVLGSALFLAGLASGVLAVAAALPLVVAGALGLSLGLSMAWTSILVYVSELYPTRVRAVASGWAAASGRCVALVTITIMAGSMGSWEAGRGVALGSHALLLLVGAAGTALFGVETRGKTLEETSA
ncbi:MAG: MFS transporter, partial [Chloroflexi bacterium]|nr:MFS transporter [Chloroflexota bacterium]